MLCPAGGERNRFPLAKAARSPCFARATLRSAPLCSYYTMTGAPNPIIVDVAAAELGVELAPVYKEVDLMGMENRSPVRRPAARPSRQALVLAVVRISKALRGRCC